MNYKVYLAGPIAAVDLSEAIGWRDDATDLLNARGINAYSPLRGKLNLLPSTGAIGNDPANYTTSPLTRAKGITTRDRYDVTSADMMIANLLSMTERSIGTAIEFGWADMARVPVILIIEPEGSIADHPMIQEIAGFQVETVEAACALAAQILLP